MASDLSERLSNAATTQRPMRRAWLGLLLAMAAAGCADTPTSPSASASALTRGAVPLVGAPAPAGDSLGTVSAVGATRFLAFGDSITYGVTSSFDGAFLFLDAAPSLSYPSQLDTLLESTFLSQDFTVDNFGVPGDEARSAVSSGRFAQALAAKRPQGVLLLEGINDLNFGASVGAVVSALQQMIEIAQLYNATVLIGTMYQTCMSVDPMSGRVRQNSVETIGPFNSAIRGMAAGRLNVYVVDLHAAFGNNCAPDRGVGLLGGDGLHPSPSGYNVMANTFATAIRDRFPVRGSFQ